MDALHILQNCYSGPRISSNSLHICMSEHAIAMSEPFVQLAPVCPLPLVVSRLCSPCIHCCSYSRALVKVRCPYWNTTLSRDELFKHLCSINSKDLPSGPRTHFLRHHESFRARHFLAAVLRGKGLPVKAYAAPVGCEVITDEGTWLQLEKGPIAMHSLAEYADRFIEKLKEVPQQACAAVVQPDMAAVVNGTIPCASSTPRCKREEGIVQAVVLQTSDGVIRGVPAVWPLQNVRQPIPVHEQLTIILGDYQRTCFLAPVSSHEAVFVCNNIASYETKAAAAALATLTSL
jgi:hypothetical protein